MLFVKPLAQGRPIATGSFGISEVHSVNGLNWAEIPPFPGSKFAYSELKSFTYQALVWVN
jgi:hypothetical protein